MLFLHVKHLEVQKNRQAEREQESAAAHRLLRDLTDELHLPPAPVATTDRGRPFFEGLPFVDFSLAHTSSLAVCALSCRKEGDLAPRVGVDAESRVRYTDEKIAALAARFFGKHEEEAVTQARDKATAFTAVFTRKEAFAKYTGEGLGRHWKGTDTLHPDFEAAHNVRFFTYAENGVTICLCTSRDEEQPPRCVVKK